MDRESSRTKPVLVEGTAGKSEEDPSDKEILDSETENFHSEILDSSLETKETFMKKEDISVVNNSHPTLANLVSEDQKLDETTHFNKFAEFENVFKQTPREPSAEDQAQMVSNTTSKK